MDAAEKLLGARRIFVPANGLDFEVFEAGAGDRLALLLHGFPQHAAMWRNQIPLLVEKGYRVWAVNQRGYGQTTRPRETAAYSLDALTGDVAGLIDAAGPSEVTLLAHDWGGFVAFVVAARRLRPLAKLVFFNIPHPLCFRRALATHWRQRLKSWYVAFFQTPGLPDRLLAAGEGALLAYMLRHDAPGAFSDEVLALYRANVCAPGAATAMLNWYRAAGRDILAAADLERPIETPALMIWGEADLALDVACLEGTGRRLTDARLARLPGVSHWTPEDAPEATAQLLRRFL